MWLELLKSNVVEATWGKPCTKYKAYSRPNIKTQKNKTKKINTKRLNQKASNIKTKIKHRQCPSKLKKLEEFKHVKLIKPIL